jgi:pimeloyl-ACP methyl ester carboxylesterase
MRGRTTFRMLAGGAAGVALAAAVANRRWNRVADLTGWPQTLPPVREWTLERPDGTRLAVAEANEQGSPTMVLAHCWTGDRRVWGGVARRLAEAGAHVVLYDHRGHGRSTLEIADASLEALGDDLAALIEGLPAERVLLAGHSMGGMTAQAFLQRHPQLAARKVAALGLVATATDRQHPGRLLAAWNLFLMRSPLTRALLGLRLAGPLLVRFTVGRNASLAHLRSVIETYVATPAPACASFLGAMYAMDFSDTLRAVRVPTVIVSGTRDLVTLPRRSRRMAELMPQARLVVIEGAGHMLPLEEPDRIAGILLELAGEARLDRVPALEHA